MPITLDVDTRLDNESARRTANQAQAFFSTAGDRAGDDFSRNLNRGLGKVDTSRARREALTLGRAYDRAADQASHLAREEAKLDAVQKSGTATQVQLITQVGRAEKARRDHARAIREATKAYYDLERAESGVGRRLDIGGGPRASMVALAGGLTVAAGAAAAASGAMILLPGVIGSAAGAFGVLKLATAGFGDAIKDMGDPKKFAEDLQSLSPNAQQAALSIRSLMPEFTELKKVTQDALFAGTAQQINRLTNQYLPTIKEFTTGTAGAFNTMLGGVGDQLMTPQTQQAMKQFMDNTVRGFQELAGAAAPFTKAITDIMAVGSEFFPGMGRGVADMAQKFSDFISQARESGQLKQWIGDGLDIIKELGSMVWEAGRAFMSLAPVAQEILPYITAGLREVADIMHEHPALIYGVIAAFAAWKTIEGVAALSTALTSISTMLRTTLPAAAATGAAGIAASLAKVAVPAWLAYMVGQQKDEYDKQHTGVDPNDPDYFNKMKDRIDWSKMGSAREALSPGSTSGFRGGGGSFDPPIPPPTILPGKADYKDWYPKALPQAGIKPWEPQAVPGVPSDAAPFIDPSRYSVASNPVVPPYYPALGPQGQVDPQRVYDAQSSVMRSRNTLEQDRLRLLQLEAKGNADQLELMRAKNQVAEDERAYVSSQMKLAEAQRGTVKKLQGFTDDMGEIGAKLDADFGASKGIGGLAENLTKFLANLAAAPLLGQLSAIAQANPSKGGYGMMGILGAQGYFGPQFTGIPEQTGYPGAGYPAAGYPGSAATARPVGGGQPYGMPLGTNSGGYGGGGARFPDWVYQLGNAFGVKPSTYPGHQEKDGLNKGIDWSGPVANMQRFAEYLATIPGSLEQVIWDNPNTGQKIGIANGQFVGPGTSQPGYYGSDWADHQNHVHTRQSYSIPSPAPALPTPAQAYAPLPDPVNASAIPLGGGGGGLTGPMQGWSPSQQTTSRIGGVEPSSGGSGKGGFGITPGGTIDTAMGVAATGLDLLAPGAGQAAQTGMKLANRAIQYGGQVAGIATQGLMDTFLPTGGSELANKSWLTKILGGIAGAAPALPNMAGKSTAPQKQGGDQNQTNNTNTTTYNTTIHNNRDTGDGLMRDFEYATMQQNKAPGM